MVKEYYLDLIPSNGVEIDAGHVASHQTLHLRSLANCFIRHLSQLTEPSTVSTELLRRWRCYDNRLDFEALTNHDLYDCQQSRQNLRFCYGTVGTVIPKENGFFHGLLMASFDSLGDVDDDHHTGIEPGTGGSTSNTSNYRFHDGNGKRHELYRWLRSIRFITHPNEHCDDEHDWINGYHVSHRS